MPFIFLISFILLFKDRFTNWDSILSAFSPFVNTHHTSWINEKMAGKFDLPTLELNKSPFCAVLNQRLAVN